MMLAREASIISIILSFTIPTPPTSTITYCLCPYSCYRCLLLLSGEVAGPAPAATPEIGQRLKSGNALGYGLGFGKHGRFWKPAPKPIQAGSANFPGLRGCRKASYRRNGIPMMLMMLAQGCSKLKMCHKPEKHPKYVPWAVFEAVNTSIDSTCTA